MARSSRPRRIRGSALQRRSGRESRSHDTRAEKRSAADYRCSSEGSRAASGCGASRSASGCASSVSRAAEGCEDAGEVGRTRKVNEGRAGKDGSGKNNAGKNKPGAAQCIKKFSKARERAVAVAPRFVAPAFRRLFVVEVVAAAFRRAPLILVFSTCATGFSAAKLLRST